MIRRRTIYALAFRPLPYCLTYLGRSVDRSDSRNRSIASGILFSKGQSCFKRLTARVRLPQTSLMRSEDRSVPQAIPCHPLSQATAAESHPDPIGSSQKFGSTILRSISSSSLLAHLPEQHRTFGEESLLDLYLWFVG
jgi:hypothetical protein